MYKSGTELLKKRGRLEKYGFNWSPVYRRTTVKIVKVNEDLHYIKSISPVDEKQNIIATFNESLYIADKHFYKEKLEYRKN